MTTTAAELTLVTLRLKAVHADSIHSLPLSLTLPMNILISLSLTFILHIYHAYGTSSPVAGGQNSGIALAVDRAFPPVPSDPMLQATDRLQNTALFATSPIITQLRLHRRGKSTDNDPSASTGKPSSCRMELECHSSSTTAVTNLTSLLHPLPTGPGAAPPILSPLSAPFKTPWIEYTASTAAGNTSSVSQTVATGSTSSPPHVSSNAAQNTTSTTTNTPSISHSQPVRSSGSVASSVAHAESTPPSSASPSTNLDTLTTTVTNNIGGSSLSSSSSPAETPTGAIIGAAVAGASALIVVLTVAFWLVWRRRRGGTLRQWAIPYGFLDSWGNEAPPPYVPSPALESQGGPFPTKEDSAPKMPMPTYGYTSFEPQVHDDNDSYFDPPHGDGESESHIHSDSDMGTVHTNPSEARLMDSSHPGREVLAPLRRVPTAASGNGE